jgi:hypothetical protein
LQTAKIFSARKAKTEIKSDLSEKFGRGILSRYKQKRRRKRRLPRSITSLSD